MIVDTTSATRMAAQLVMTLLKEEYQAFVGSLTEEEKSGEVDDDAEAET